MSIRRLVTGGGLLFGLLGAAAQAAEEPRPTPQPPPPAKAPGSLPSDRDLFVPIWTEPVTRGKEPPATARRVRADFVWTGVPLAARGVEPSVKPEAATATLVEFRPSSAAPAPGRQRNVVVIIRQKGGRVGATPFLELIDGDTMLQTRGWGRQIRRTGDTADWMFVLQDPVVLPAGRPNPVSARLDRDTRSNRTFELRLVSDVPANK